MSAKWPRVKLGEVLKQIWREEKVNPSSEYRLLGARWYGGGLFIKDVCLGQQIRADRIYQVQKGDFVYNRLFAWKGSFALAGPESNGCYVSNEFPCFELDQYRLDSNFLWWYFRREIAWNEVLKLSTGATPTSRNRLKERIFLNLDIPLPPLAEQRRIVARIEELAAQIKEARILRQQWKEEAKVLARSIAAKFFNESAKLHPLHPLSEFVTVRGGGTPSKSDPSYWQGEIPWISPKDMKVHELRDAADHISERATQETAAKLIDSGAVLIVVRGMILSHTFPSAVLRVPGAINQDMKALIPSPRLLPEFLCSLLWAYNPQILDLVEKSTHDTRRLEISTLLSTKIPVPSIPGQLRILAEQEALQAQMAVLKSLQAEAATQIDALLPSILMRAFDKDL
jgi:type I restriction enzyme S subunit